jgi:hypothetical protein
MEAKESDRPMRAGTLAKSVVIVAALAVVVSACGRRPATLMTPHQAAMEERREAEREGVEQLPPEPAPPVRDRRFILDGLI